MKVNDWGNLPPDEVARREQALGIEPIDDPTPFGIEDRDAVVLRVGYTALIMLPFGLLAIVAGIGYEVSWMTAVGFVLIAPFSVLLLVAMAAVVYGYLYWVATGRRGEL